MKKIVLSLLFVAATLNAMATVTAQAKLTLTAGTASCEMYVVETDEDVAEYNAIMNMSGRYIALFAKNDGKKYEVFAMPKLEDLKLGLKTNAETSYKITASDVIGTVKIQLPGGQGLFVINADGDNVTFNATPNKEDYLADSMVVNPHAVPEVFKLCHQNGMIVVDNETESELVVKLDGDSIGRAPAKTFGAEISLDGKTAGHHELIVVGKDTVIINVKPEVTPLP